MIRIIYYLNYMLRLKFKYIFKILFLLIKYNLDVCFYMSFERVKVVNFGRILVYEVKL